jgi:hypothetical protein
MTSEKNTCSTRREIHSWTQRRLEETKRQECRKENEMSPGEQSSSLLPREEDFSFISGQGIRKGQRDKRTQNTGKILYLKNKKTRKRNQSEGRQHREKTGKRSERRALLGIRMKWSQILVLESGSRVSSPFCVLFGHTSISLFSLSPSTDWSGYTETAVGSFFFMSFLVK